MSHLFAPWRHAWVTGAARDEAGPGPSGPACLFCRVHAQPHEDVHNLVAIRGKTALVMLNRYPYNGGHLMVVPAAHEPSLERLTPEQRADLVELAAASTRVLTRLWQPQGFNLGVNQGAAAGAGIPDHVHLHVVPRWGGDTNFMTAVGGTRVISQDLAETRAALAEAFAGEAGQGTGR